MSVELRRHHFTYHLNATRFNYFLFFEHLPFFQSQFFLLDFPLFPFKDIQFFQNSFLQRFSDNYENKVYLLPKYPDEEVARPHLEKIGCNLAKLILNQAEYINFSRDGPFKSESYRY